MGFSRQEYWSGLPYPPPGNLPDPGIEPMYLESPALAGGFFTTSAAWEAHDDPWKWKWKLLSYVGLFVTPWTMQSLKFSRSEHWSGYLSLLQGIFHPRDRTQVSHIAGGFFTNQGRPWSLVPATSPIPTLLKALMHRVGDVELVYFAWVSLWLTLSVSLRICSRLIFSTKPSLTCLFRNVSPSPLYAQPSSTLNFSLLNLLPYDKIYVLCACHQSRNFFSDCCCIPAPRTYSCTLYILYILYTIYTYLHIQMNQINSGTLCIYIYEWIKLKINLV